jgi:hypothetical protein
MITTKFTQTGLILFAVLAIAATTFAAGTTNSGGPLRKRHATSSQPVPSYSFTDQKVSSDRRSGTVSPGSQSADGGSPGSIAGRSYEDHQAQFDPDSCGCGNVNCGEDGKITLSDLTRFIDWFFISMAPLQDTSSADVDHCDYVDFADLVLFNEHTRRMGPGSGSPSFCSGTVDCDFSPEGDTVRIVAAHSPSEALDDNLLQMDIYVRNTLRLAAAELAFVGNNPNLVFDSAVYNPLVDTGFRWGTFARYSSGQTMAFEGVESFVYGLGLEADPSQERLWASYYFTLTSWAETDSIVFDTAGSSGTRSWFKLVKSPYDDSSADSLGFRPVWAGPVVVYDARHECCGRYTGGITGNCNCSVDGKLTLSDVACMIDIVYINKVQQPCCPANNNTNGSWDDGACKKSLSDITRLIDAVFISKDPPEPCMVECE